MWHLVALVAQAHFLQHVLHALVHAFAVGPSGGFQHEEQVVVHRTVREQLEVLEHDTDLPAEIRDL
jgi:hypothetical protein